MATWRSPECTSPGIMGASTGGKLLLSGRRNTNLASEAWQIGSVSPPTICLCCGSRFDEDKHKMRGPYDAGPYRYVCEWCWKKSYMFFPDKIEKKEIGGLLAYDGLTTKRGMANFQITPRIPLREFNA